MNEKGTWVKFLLPNPPFMPGDTTRIKDPAALQKLIDGKAVRVLNEDGSPTDAVEMKEEITTVDTILNRTVPEIRAEIEGLKDMVALDRLYEAEEEGKGRVGVLDAIEARQEQLKEDAEEPTD